MRKTREVLGVNCWLTTNNTPEDGEAYRVRTAASVCGRSARCSFPEKTPACLSGLGITQYDFDTLAAEKEFRRAIELNPQYASAHQWYAHLLGYMKCWDECLQEATQALKLDPLSGIIQLAYTGCFH